ncbi:MAG: LacI family DNA-binding transcriptional regulator [Lentisphaeria bacterium]|nr:LacI family DNA-binding transcriptional regulator [Lentisphaeria bacterium]
MARKPGKISVSSLAAELGVSVATISRVINNRTGVDEEKRREILAHLQRRSFRVNYPRQRGVKIALVTEHAGLSSYVTMVLEGIYRYSRGTELQVNLLIYEKHIRESLLSILRDQQYAGAILPSPIWLCPQMEELAASGLPAVLIDKTMAIDGIGCIDHDSYGASRLAVDYLISLGHSKIGYAGDRRIDQQKQRFRGYLDAMRSHGIEPEPAWCILREGNSNYFAFGHDAFDRLAGRAPELTAVAALDDDTAIGMLSRAGERGIRIPEELSVIGFKDTLASRYANPPLTTVHYPMMQAGEIAVRSIHEFLESSGNAPLPRMVLPGSLVPRGSTAPPREKEFLS